MIAMGNPQQTQYAHRRDYVGQPINAVVVRKWENREAQNRRHGLFDQWMCAIRSPFSIPMTGEASSRMAFSKKASIPGIC